jgi:hypothetical protein
MPLRFSRTAGQFMETRSRQRSVTIYVTMSECERRSVEKPPAFVRGGGGTGRRKGLKIPCPARDVPVRFRPSAPIFSCTRVPLIFPRTGPEQILSARLGNRRCRSAQIRGNLKLARAKAGVAIPSQARRMNPAGKVSRLDGQHLGFGLVRRSFSEAGPSGGG